MSAPKPRPTTKKNPVSSSRARQQGVWTRRDAGLPAPRWRVPPSQIEPNASHLALVKLQQLGKLQFLVTQNTDNLHRRSGVSPELLAELHGNGELMRCL